MLLDVTNYDVPFERFEMVDGERKHLKGMEPLNVKHELYEMLRLPGLFKDGIEVVDAVLMARKIRDAESDNVELDANEEKLLKSAFNKLIDREHNPQSGMVALGGPRYEEMILRVFKK